MQFRTEIGRVPNNGLEISHDDGIFMIGSCFTDNIGELLERDGFDVEHNPLGPLYNPCSIVNALKLILTPEPKIDFMADDEGIWHCLAFASRYSSEDIIGLDDRLRDELSAARKALQKASTVIVTLGTAYVYRWAGPEPDHHGRVVGNCHKFKPQCFLREKLSVAQVQAEIEKTIEMLPGKNIIFTVSPIRHIADGLHGNQISKSTLLLALDNFLSANKIADRNAAFPSSARESNVSKSKAIYFPAYEIMLDDLRDYRFYAADMKHPSDVAIDYIYETFAHTFFTAHTQQQALASRAAYLRRAHRPLNK